MNAAAQIFTGGNGTAIAGITAITLIVLFDRVIKGEYKLSGKKGDSEFMLEPTGRASAEGQLAPTEMN